MSSGRNKDEIISFKVDAALSRRMEGIANRSDFIRTAILLALGNSCPVCGGTGTLSAAQRRHWEEFTRHHHMSRCSDCRESYLVCDHETGPYRGAEIQTALT